VVAEERLKVLRGKINMRSKVTIIGAGNVGSTCAQQLAQRDYANIVLVDIIEGYAQGKALDILEASPILGFNSKLAGTDDFAQSADSDVVIITSGVPRKPGMSRDELTLTNMKITKDVTEKVAKYSPNCIIIMVTNPLDAMTQLALQVSKFPRNRVLGQSGALDAARFRTFIAQELDVSVEDVFACVLGGHGSTMVPLPRLSTVAGIPITEVLPKEKIHAIVQRVINGGEEIVELLKTSSAFYAPGAAVVQVVDAIILDKKRILPCAVYLEGEYGISGVTIGVPVKLGKNGMEQVIELRLNPEEAAALKKSAEAVQELLNVMSLAQ
jgi:malate dehydrogenase